MPFTTYLIEWPGLTRRQYQTLIRELNWDRKVTSGSLCYNAGPKKGDLVLLEVWESREAFEHFFHTRLARVLIEIGLPQPFVKSWQVPGPEVKPASGSKKGKRFVGEPGAVTSSLHNWSGRQENQVLFGFN